MTDIAIKDIPAALVDIHAKLATEMGEQPGLAPVLECNQRGGWFIILYNRKCKRLQDTRSDSPTAAIRQALDFIAGMASKDEQRKLGWQKSLTGVINEGHDLNLPDTVLAPLRASSQAMTENLIGVAK
jgi:hypothetical protein